MDAELRAFRDEGFYERFPAKGQVERVARIHRELGRLAGDRARRAQAAGPRSGIDLAGRTVIEDFGPPVVP